MGKAASAVTNVVGDISGSNRAADAAQRSALDQQSAARASKNEIMGIARQNQTDAMALAEASPMELAALNRSYSSAEQALGREERLLAAIDPALMEASSQALKLLRGESADINAPMQNLRNSQRQQLVNSLRSQYGPAAESTGIGSRILQQFDMESSAQMAQNNQNALGTVFGIASQDFGGRAQRGIANLQQVGQGFGALQDRKLNARMNTGNAMLSALGGTSQAVIQSAGAGNVGAALRGQAQQGLFNSAIGIGAQAAMAGSGGGGGGAAKPTGGFKNVQQTGTGTWSY